MLRILRKLGASKFFELYLYRIYGENQALPRKIFCITSTNIKLRNTKFSPLFITPSLGMNFQNSEEWDPYPVEAPTPLAIFELHRELVNLKDIEDSGNYHIRGSRGSIAE